MYTGRDSARRLRRELKDKRRREWYVRVGTSRHVAVALYTNSIMHARANINYHGFNIGRRRWPWPTTSWAKHVKRGESPVNAIAILQIAREIPRRFDIKTCKSYQSHVYFDKIIQRNFRENHLVWRESHSIIIEILIFTFNDFGFNFRISWFLFFRKKTANWFAQLLRINC